MLGKILLVEKDVGYGSAIAAAMSNSQSDYEVTIADFEKLKEKEYKKTLDRFDLILIGGYSLNTLESSGFPKLYIRKLVVLTESPVETLVNQIKKENRRCWYLYKYTRLSVLLSDLSFLLTFITGKKYYTRNHVAPNIIGFFSASGGVGKTSIAIATARELSRFHDKKVLYLSFEDISATELYFRTNLVSRNISDYLYFLLEKQENNLSGRLESFVSNDSYGVETFSPSGSINDLRYLNNEELIIFLESIYESNRYDFIIVDLNCDLTECTQLLLEQCKKIVLIQSDRPVSSYKNEKLITSMESLGIIKSAEILIFVINMRTGIDSEIDNYEDGNTKKHRQIYIEDDKASFCLINSSMEISIDHSFGIGVKRIADEILIQIDTRN
ncbi:MAG: AAA family ATPase [Anaerovoracaceae bacterium]|jgi:cellulose biosynthesis protein BcsQ